MQSADVEKFAQVRPARRTVQYVGANFSTGQRGRLVEAGDALSAKSPEDFVLF